MSTVRAGSLTGWCSFASVEPGVLWPSATVKTLVDGRPIWMKGSPTMPALEVNAVSLAAEEMELFRTPSLGFFSVRALVSASEAGTEAVVSLIVLEFSRILVFKKEAWPPASMEVLAKISLTCFVGLRAF